jgi:hypothetical protein
MKYSPGPGEYEAEGEVEAERIVVRRKKIERNISLKEIRKNTDNQNVKD